MIRRLARWAGRAALGIAILAVLVVAVLHTPPGRNLLRNFVLAGLRRGGLEARLDRVEVGALGLEARVFGLDLARPGYPPFLHANRATARLRPSVLRGQISLRELVAQGVALDLVRDGNGDWNLPETSKPAGPAAPDDLRPLLLARIALSDVDLHVRAAGELDVAATGLGLDWSGDKGTGTLNVRDDVVWRTEERQGRLTLSSSTVTTDARGLTLAGLRVSGPEGELALSATLGLVGANAPLAIDAEGRFHLRPLLGPAAPSVEGRIPWKARVRGTLTSPALELDLRSEGLSVATLHVETVGLIRVADDQVSVEGQVKDGTLPLGGRLFGTLKAHWPLARPREIEATLDTRVEPSKEPKSPQDLAWRGQAQLRLASEHYALTLDHRLGEGARLVGRAEGPADLMQPLRSPLAGTLQIDVASPAAILGLLADRHSPSPPPWWSALEGQLKGEIGLQGTVGEPVARGRLSAAGLTGQGLPPIGATAQLRVGVSQAELESLEVQGASATLRGDAQVPFDGRPLKGRFQGRFEDLGAWSSALPSAWAPSGQLAFEATIAGSLARPEFEATVDGSGVGLLDQPTLQRVQGRLRGSVGALRLEALSLEQAKGRLEIAGHVEPEARAYSVRASAEDFAFGPLPKGAVTEQGLPVRGQLQGKVEWGVTDGEAKGGGRFELRDFSWDERSLGKASVELARDETRPHGVSVELRLDGADLRAFARAAGVADDRISGTTTLAVRLRGDAANPAQGTGELDLDRLEGTAFDLPLKLLGPAHLVAEAGRASVRDLELDLAGGRLAADGALGSSGEKELRAEWHGPLDGWSPVLAATAEEGEAAPRLVGDGALTMVVRGTLEAPRPEATLRIAGGGVNRDEEPVVRSLALDASLREGTLRVEALEATFRDFHWTLTGEAGAGLLPPSVPAALRSALGGDARARAHLSIDRAASAPVVPGGEPLRVEADLETDALRYDRVRAKAEVTGLGVEVKDVPLRPDRNFTLELAEGLLTIPTVSWHGGDNDLRLGGTVRLPAESGAPLSAALLDLEASGAIDLRLLGALGRGIEAGGLAQLEGHVRGSLAAPAVEGSFGLEAAVFRYRPWRISLDDVSARARATTGRIVLETFSGTLNGGTLEGKGELMLAGAKASGGLMALSLTGAALDWPSGFRGSLDGGLELRGGAEGPVLAGTLTLANAAYKGDPRTLVPVAKPSLRSEGSGGSSLLAGLALDVRFQSDHEVRVDTPFGAFPFSLDLRATGTAAAPRLQGAVTLGAGGYIYWSGRRFTLERGALTWSPVGGLVPFVESRATTRVSSYTVMAQFSGPLTSADTGLTSNPPLSESEIASLLTTGNTSAGGQDSRALGIVSANFLGNLGHVAGLDSVRIESADETSLLSFDPTRVASETNPAQRLTITKRLSENLEATVSLNLSESGKTTTFVGWKPIPAVEVRVSQRDDYTGSLELRHDVSFGGGGREEQRKKQAEASRHGGRETVRSVRIEDDGGAARRRLLGRLKLKEGKTFRYEEWQKDRERVEAAVARGGYGEAYVIARREPRTAPPEGGEVALTYLIRRGPRTRVEIRGDLTPPDAPDTLRREIAAAWSKGDFERSIEEEALLRVRTSLAQSGHFTPRLAADIETSKDGAIRTLVISGEPGPKARKRRVAFSGAALVPGEKLEALVKGKALEDQAWSDPKRLEAAVITLYRKEGFLAAAVHAQPVMEGEEAILAVEIEEGPLFQVGTLDVRGCARVECTDASAVLGLKSGAPYREDEVGAARARVMALYRKRGFNAAQVRLDGEIRTRTAQVDVRLTIDEGAQQVIREVVAEGADPATRRALDHAVTLRPGEPVVLEDWATIRKRLYGTGLVRGVTLEPEVLPKEDGPEVLPKEDRPVGADSQGAVEPVRAKVAYDMWPALRVRYGLQLVTEKPLTESGDNAVDLGATAELTRAIFLGHAVSTALSGEVRPDIWNTRAVLSLPRTFGIAVRSSLYLIREHQKTEVDVPTLAITIPAASDKWQATVEERWRRGKLETALSYDIQWLTLSFPETDFTDAQFRPARLVGTVLMDGRNNILDPRKGYFSSVSADYGAKVLGSEFDFSRVFTQQFAYIPTLGGIVAASGVRFERASGGGQSFLATERLSFGGPTTIRGYERDRVDLLDLFAAVGATTDVLILNQELRFPILGDLRGVGFVDFGKFAAHFEDTRGTETRLGAGLGLRYSTPVGVLRVDLGFPLRGSDKKGKLYFGLGQAF